MICNKIIYIIHYEVRYGRTGIPDQKAAELQQDHPDAGRSDRRAAAAGGRERHVL